MTGCDKLIEYPARRKPLRCGSIDCKAVTHADWLPWIATVGTYIGDTLTCAVVESWGWVHGRKKPLDIYVEKAHNSPTTSLGEA